MPAVTPQHAYTLCFDALHGFLGSLLHAVALINALPSGETRFYPAHI